MKNKSSLNKYVIMCVVFVISIIAIAFSISFAYMESDILGELTETKVNTGTFDIKTSLTNTTAINTKNMMLISEDEIEDKSNKISFTVQAASTTGKAGEFNVYLKDVIIDKGLIDPNFKWQLLMDDEIIGEGDFSNIDTDGIKSETNTNTDTTNYYDMFYLKKAISFKEFNESTLEIRVYTLNDSTVNQNNLLYKTMQAKIGVEAYSVK
ncbi:MAG: hypothetical protein J6B98_06645 [Bacilli bacterium]|nr:hypothetical protein [Bacilli bacterium]